MAPLAQAFVRLRVDSSTLAAEATRDAAAAGERAGAAMGTRMSSGLSRTFKAAVGIGAATGLVELGKKVYDLADAFEGARARVEQNTENIGAAFDDVQKPLDDLDKKMAAFGFTVTDTENSFAQLVTATRDPAKAMRDVALAADIARGRHESLDAATQTLMKVETGHVAMLGRLGIATRDASGHMFTQQEAIEALGRAYGGNADRFAQTLAGHMAAARAEMQLAGTQIGVALLPALTDLANVLAHDVLPPIATAAHWLDQNRKTIEPLAKALVIGIGAWKLYSFWVAKSAAANLLFARTAPAAAAGAAGAVGAATAARGAATAGAGAAVATEGAAIGTGMAAGLNTSFLGLASSAAIAARNVGMMGLATLGFVNFIKNPRSLGFPFGFNNDLNPGGVHKGQKLTNDAGQTVTVTGAQTIFLDKAGHQFSDPGLKHLITDTKAATEATRQATSAETTYGAVVQRTAAQIASHAEKTINFKSAQDAVRQAMHDAAQTAADNGRALQGNSDAALANRAALINQATAVLNVIDVMKANGSSAANQATMLDVLTQAVEINATKTYGNKAAVDALLASLGLIPAAVNTAAAALASLPAVTQQNINSDNVTPGALHQLNQAVTQAKATASKQGADVAKSFTDGYSPIVAKVPKAAKDAADKAAAAFNKLKDQMKSDLQTIRDSVDSTRSSVAGFADFAAQGTDALGASGLNTDVAGQLKAKAGKLEQFARLFNQLDRAGLDAHLMAQFAQTGPDAIPAMQALLHSGKRGIGQVNRIEQRIQTAAGSVARTETAEQNAGLIHKDLTTLPAKLGREFRNGLKGLHIPLDIRAVDYKNGIAVVVSP